jgi:formylglycine-generating enzyme required for sulfatase activity
MHSSRHRAGPTRRTAALLLSLALAAAAAAPSARGAEDTRLVNLSTRAAVGLGDDILIAGFVIGQGAARTVLVRGIGPALTPFEVHDALADPVLTLFDADGARIAANDDWQAGDAAVFASVGAFAIEPGSKDAALVVTLAPGRYTAHVSGANGGTGVSLLEIYEVDAGDARLVNLSGRAFVGTGDSVAIPGLVVAPGSNVRRLLVRAAGPALTAHEVNGVLADPMLAVVDAAGTVLARNDDWGTPHDAAALDASTMEATFTQSGAFAFTTGSKDAAAVISIAPGAYTIVVSGAGATTGIALVEVYDITDAAPIEPSLVTAATGEPILSPIATTCSTVTDGSRTVQVPHGMVCVAAGAFTMGTGSTATTVSIPAYCIGKFEVTNAEYKAFLDATGAKSFPQHWVGGTYREGKGNHPVTNVSLTSALAYCAWVSEHTGWNVTIPTAEQWEKAARGPGAFLYPWGDSAGSTYAGGVLSTRFNYNAVCAALYLGSHAGESATYNNSNSPYYGTTTTVGRIAAFDASGTPTYLSISSSGSVSGWVNHTTWTGFIYTDVFDALNDAGGLTSAVGGYENGKSAYGCYDMAGNEWEWTTTMITATNGAEAGQLVNEIRGGSWYATSTSGRSIGIGEGRAASGAYNTVGFRIVVNLP